MSAHSGFGTRRQETLYDRLTEELLSLLVWRMMCCLNKESVQEEAWEEKFVSKYGQMIRLETQKFHPPKFAPICSDISDFFSSKVTVPSQTPLPLSQEIHLIREPIFPSMKTRSKRKSVANPTSLTFEHQSRNGLKTPFDSRKNHHGFALKKYLHIADKFDKLKRNIASELRHIQI